MSDIVYPVYMDGLAIYLTRGGDPIKAGTEIPKTLIDSSNFRALPWSYGDGYTQAFDQLCAIEAAVCILGHDPSNIAMAALMFGKWVAIDQDRLSMVN